MTKGLIKSSKIKQKLYNKYLKNRTLVKKNAYKVYKTMFEKLKRNSKKNHYQNLLESNQNDPRKTWRIIKHALGKSKKTSLFPNRMVIDTIDCFDEDKIANHFNEYFVNVGSNLASRIPKAVKHFTDYLNITSNIMPENDLSQKELNDAFKLIDVNKSPGYDEITGKVVKAVSNEIRNPLMYIFNLSFKTGIFPDKMKIARIIPLFKSEDSSSVNNYRPISILPVFSKFLERIIYNRIYTYIKSNNLLYQRQYGFQKNHSTDHAIIDLVDEITKKFENNEYVLGVFIDLSKAFDTVDHDILLDKLKYFGIHNNNHKLLKNYLANRKQYISYNNKRTSLLNIIFGVPQGSILGPLLFLLYINDLAEVCQKLYSILFADDTNLFFSHSNINELFSTMNDELSNLNQWFVSNKLSLNIKKN